MPVLDKNNTHRSIYISKRCGRLANRLVIFANLIAYAEEYELRLRNYTFHSYCKEFESTLRDFHCQYPPPDTKPWLSRLPLIGDALIGLRLYYRVIRMMSRRPNSFQGTTLEETDTELFLDTPDMVKELSAFRTIFVSNWKCRCPNLVSKHAHIIRNYFRPIARHREAIEKVVTALRSNSEVLVGVHIRQGDYEQWQGGRFYFTSSEYAELMKAFTDHFPGKKVSFLICSAEHQEETLFTGLTFAKGPGHPVSDLYSLSQCDYIIGPVSTFSQWASFYGEVPLFHLGRNQVDLKLSEFKVSDLRILDK